MSTGSLSVAAEALQLLLRLPSCQIYSEVVAVQNHKSQGGLREGVVLSPNFFIDSRAKVDTDDATLSVPEHAGTRSRKSDPWILRPIKKEIY